MVGEGGSGGEVPSPSSPPAPCVFWDAKGPTWEDCKHPLEISAITLSHLHGDVLHEASAFISYPADRLEGIRKDCHVSLLRGGGTMDQVEQRSLYSKPVMYDNPREQAQQFFASHVFGPLKKAKIADGDVFLPIWNAGYEGWLLPFKEYSERVGYNLRLVEMRGLSAWLTGEFGLPVPERGEWTSLENNRWAVEKCRELFPSRKRARKGKK